MDRRAERGIKPHRRRCGLASLAIACVGLLAGSLSVAANRLPTPLLQMLEWTERSHHGAAATLRPKTCLAPAADVAEAQQVARGALLFQSPALLGGQAARGRLSCASCHTNGRDNPHFFLGGISGRPGSADVTSSFFGIARANGRFDPVPIPDLVQPGRISRDPSTGDLERFVRVLIVEEFSGSPPDGASLAAIAAYVRALRQCEVDPDGREAVTLDHQIDAVRDGVAGAVAMARAGDDRAEQQMIAATRHQLGLISERYVAVRSGAIQRDLSRYALRLAGRPAGPHPVTARTTQLAEWLGDFEREMVPKLERHRGQSYYSAPLVHRLLESGDAGSH